MAAIAQGLGRLIARGITVKDIARAGDCDPRTINNALNQRGLMHINTALAIVTKYPDAGEELTTLYGLAVGPRIARAANDLEVVGKACDLASTISRARSDGFIDHREVCEIADIAMQLNAETQPYIATASRLRGGR